MALLFFFAYNSFLQLPAIKNITPGKSLIVTGKVSANPNEKIKIHPSGAVFVWPVIQDFFYLSHDPIHLKINLPSKNGLKKEIQVTVNISNKESQTLKAAKFFGNKDEVEIRKYLISLIQGELNSSAFNNELSLDAIQKIIINKLFDYGCDLMLIE